MKIINRKMKTDEYICVNNGRRLTSTVAFSKTFYGHKNIISDDVEG